MTHVSISGFLLILVTLLTLDLYAQVPKEFNYQAVARDGSGIILANQNVSLKATICTDANCSSPVWTETHAALTTNQFGLINVALGSVVVLSVDFGVSAHYLKIEMDIGGGFIDMGTTQLLSVPYAMVSGGPFVSNGSDIYYDNGKVGIGISSPVLGLHIKQYTTNRAIQLEHHSTNDNWTIGVGASTRNFKMIYNGLSKADIASVDGAYLQISDVRFKKNIEPLGSILNKVLQLKPAKYHYLDGGKNTVKSYGFIAQEVQSVFPEIIREIDGSKALAYSDYGVIAIAAIQEQQIIIDDQKSQIETLNNQLEKIEKELESIRQALNKSVK